MIIQADARRIPLVDGCVQCCLSSPPYFGLRDYNVTGQIGLEPSPDAYVAALVGVYREVWRVLADDGVIFLNIGDSYFGGGGYWPDAPSNQPDAAKKRGTPGAQIAGARIKGARRVASYGASGKAPEDSQYGTMKPKDLIGIPWRVAFALQADGWYLRSDIIWSKPNPMPESVTDRPTKAHEYVFLLSKSERYYYDADAIKEPHSMSSWSARSDRAGTTLRSQGKDAASLNRIGHVGAHRVTVESPYPEGGRNVRTVWTIATQSYSGAHFATMPEKLAERCILAGSRPSDLVLDPFGGSGTTVRVARRFNRRGVMLDLNPAYLQLAQERISGVQTDIFEVPA